ncbi:MAG: phosphoribosylformylglycinamidine synthase subunit PurL [Candidatus Viridilinea halotolerans]|uniref:Phosphoribosylformylglycinamidine synthase subunit PurL n=1 Tax=Candidatus Viridilinea halotolerans TaxID=2491704 RepID=A0A426TR25_9CHLR|nr:MAG: phosphoribosylformylglycinamidine synthase subunit PurL [Candidatus Viridilinea halotolerans]
MAQFLVTVAPREATQFETMQTLYVLEGIALRLADVGRLALELLHDSVVETVTWRVLTLDELIMEPLPATAHVLEVAYRPGVTDNEGESVLEGARRLGIGVLDQARALRRYLLPVGVDPQARAAELTIDLVQTSFAYVPGVDHSARLAFYQRLITPPVDVPPRVVHVALREADEAELLRMSREGILALDLAEMQAVRAYFVALGRDPSDGELETLAQTWSEHCSHKTFKAQVHYRRAMSAPWPPQLEATLYPAYHRLEQDAVELNSLLKTFLMAATQRIVMPDADVAHCTLHEGKFTLPADGWVRSAFVDNAGILAFGTAHEISFKVETHNHPSALEPFGGANTGVGGVIRDVLGVSAEPIANTDVLCFGMPHTPPEELQAGVLHPQRVARGVVAGVRDYGNELGIPTVNGAVLFDPGYTANPLVYAGTLGLAPRDAHPRNVAPGDVIVLLGGYTGRDGIHGATFSSIELTHETATTVGSAVQIGDPITEKKLLDVLLQARDQRLYSAITDCGAGGLSSAVGEMGAEGGAHVTLERVPLKYAGLQPWEIWLSEAQERMVLAVPPTNLAAFLALCAAEDVEATAIGHFTDDGRLRVDYKQLAVVDLAMAFLHDGLPQRVLDAVWQPVVPSPPDADAVTGSVADWLLQLLAHPNITSKERIVRTYDHEVRGATVLKPLVGVAMDGPGDAAVLQPLAEMGRGLALGCGINPRYGRIDPYWMALAVVDEALRNVVAVGGDPQRTAILDNFCWGDPRQPDRMAGLVRAAAGCYDAAVAFGTPFISGKDSLNNEYRDAEGQRVAIPPTLLISALAEVPDVRRSVSMDLKQAGNQIYLVGATRAELGGSHWHAIVGVDALAGQVPQVDLAAARATFVALHAALRAGLVAACHDLSEGGLAVAAAEMALAGDLGLDLDLAALGSELDVTTKLFSETPSRFLVEVHPTDAEAFAAALAGVALVPLGTVQAEPLLTLRSGTNVVAALTVDDLRRAWHAGLAWM